jgi:hypothetical protein
MGLVLTDASVDAWARAGILVAGVAATAAALLSLIRLRAREVQYSGVIAHYFTAAGLPDPRSTDELPREAYGGRVSRLDRWLQHRGRQVGPVYLWWVSALLLFAAADVLALLLTV